MLSGIRVGSGACSPVVTSGTGVWQDGQWVPGLSKTVPQKHATVQLMAVLSLGDGSRDI